MYCTEILIFNLISNFFTKIELVVYKLVNGVPPIIDDFRIEYFSWSDWNYKMCMIRISFINGGDFIDKHIIPPIVQMLWSATSFLAQGRNYCPASYSFDDSGSQKCYHHKTNEKKFSEAEVSCARLPGGHLASFQTSATFNFLFSLIGSVQTILLQPATWTLYNNSPNG